LEQLERFIDEAERNGEEWFSVTLGDTREEEPRSVSDDLLDCLEKIKQRRKCRDCLHHTTSPFSQPGAPGFCKIQGGAPESFCEVNFVPKGEINDGKD
jgi:hypothetical protein